MKDPSDVVPTWNEETVGDFVTSASAIIDLGPPSANPQVAGITLYLEVCESEDEDEEEEEEGESEDEDEDEDEYSPRFAWSVSTDEEAAGLDEAELDNGVASDFEQAKRDCWVAAIGYLRSDSYTDAEITAAAT